MDPLEFFSKYISTLIVILQCPLAFSILTVTPVSVPVHQHIASTHLHNPLLRTGILFPHSMWLPRFVWGEMSSSSITLAEPQPPPTVVTTLMGESNFASQFPMPCRQDQMLTREGYLESQVSMLWHHRNSF